MLCILYVHMNHMTCYLAAFPDAFSNYLHLSPFNSIPANEKQESTPLYALLSQKLRFKYKHDGGNCRDHIDQKCNYYLITLITTSFYGDGDERQWSSTTALTHNLISRHITLNKYSFADVCCVYGYCPSRKHLPENITSIIKDQRSIVVQTL